MKFLLDNKISKNQMLYTIAIIGTVIFIGTIVIHFNKQNYPNKANVQEQMVVQQLNRIETRLATVSKALPNTYSTSPEQITHFSNHLNAIQQSIEQLNTDEKTQELKTVFSKTNQAVIDKLQNLQQTIQQLKKQITPRQFLLSKVLPFKVISVDIWNGEPQATIAIDGSSMLLAREDTQSGWTLVDISFESALAIFSNNKQQFVKVTF